MSFGDFTDFERAEREGWDSRAAVYADTTARATTQAIPALLDAAGIASGVRMLDLCCGPGYAAGAAAALGADAEGVDAAPAMVAAARAAFPACRFETGDATALPHPDATFEAVICSFGLFHLADPATALAEMARVTRPGGRVALSHWCGPDASPFFRAVFGAIGAHADMGAVPPGPPPFALSDPAALEAALAAAGLTEVAVKEVPVVLEAPAEDFAGFFRDFSVRGAMILDAQGPEVRARIEAGWAGALAPFAETGLLRVPMPALAASGRRA